MTLLGVDVGTTGMKMGVFREEQGDLMMLAGFSKTYPVHTYNDGLFSDIDPALWRQAFADDYRHQKESSMKGAALLGLKHLKEA